MNIINKSSFKNEDEEDEKKEENKKEDDLLVKKLLKTRTILLNGEINKDLSQRIINNMLILEADDKDAPIKVFIDSPGGDLHAGYAIYDMLRFISCPIYTIGMGLIASAGALILLAPELDKRYALPNSMYLIHQPLIGGVLRGVEADIEIQAKEIEKAREHLNILISKKTNQELEKVITDTERDYWMDSKEAKDYNLVSSIVESREELNNLIK